MSNNLKVTPYPYQQEGIKYALEHKRLIIGDASGKPGQFSDSDKKTAENFGIDYMDVEDFIKLNENE